MNALLECVDDAEKALTYRELWRAVVNEAIRDSIDFDLDAIEWLLRPSDDRDDVLANAGIDADYLPRRIAMWLLASATQIARNREGFFCFESAEFMWRKPAASRRVRARHFLESDLKPLAIKCAGGWDYRNQAEADLLVKRAVIARAERAASLINGQG